MNPIMNDDDGNLPQPCSSAGHLNVPVINMIDKSNNSEHSHKFHIKPHASPYPRGGGGHGLNLAMALGSKILQIRNSL